MIISFKYPYLLHFYYFNICIVKFSCLKNQVKL